MDMKKTMIAFSMLALLLTSCGTYTGQGAYVGAQFGTILGSAVGGISGGWRGSDIGTVVGMAGGAAIGAAIGAAADQREADRYDEYRRERAARRSGSYGTETPPPADDSGYDSSNSGDDRVDFGIAGPTGEQSGTRPEMPSAAPQAPMAPAEKTVSVEDLQRARPIIELLNVRIVDQREEGVIHAGEQCKVVFEIMNRSRHTLHDIQPMVNELTGNKHLHVSPNLHIESIAPGTGVRYTATILADKRLKEGQAIIRIAVAHHDRELESQTQQFTMMTRRK
jgi:hypothetical protein